MIGSLKEKRMPLLLSRICKSEQDYKDQIQELDKISAESHHKNEHSGKVTTFPCILLTLIESSPWEKRYMTHTSITKNMILSILGLSSVDLKLELDSKEITSIVPTVLSDDREV